AQQELLAVKVNQQAVEAAIEGATAAVQLAEIDLENTRIRAPRAGHAGEIGVKLGQYVTPGSQLLALVPEQVWVVANF
ncbi:HlyD family secretion protein, partial [Acinetobacter baumannii]